jgi:ubiquinone/menaquinone biosynthesis C-methylase UbiE
LTVLGDIPEPEAALRELRRVLEPSGRLIVGEIFLYPGL